MQAREGYIVGIATVTLDGDVQGHGSCGRGVVYAQDTPSNPATPALPMLLNIAYNVHLYIHPKWLELAVIQ